MQWRWSWPSARSTWCPSTASCWMLSSRRWTSRSSWRPGRWAASHRLRAGSRGHTVTFGWFFPSPWAHCALSLSICRYEHFISLCRSQGCSSNQGGGGGGEGGNSPLFKSFQLWTVNQLYTYTPSINYRGIPIWNGETNWISPLDVAQVSHALQSNLMFLWGGVHVRGISGWSQPCGYENIACPCVSITKQKGGRQEGCGNGFMV